MIAMLTKKEFLIGCAVGYFAIPLVAKHVREQVERLKPATAAPQAG